MSSVLKAVFVALLLAAPATAQQAPSMIPTRDVAITYRSIGGPGESMSFEMAWLASAASLRADVPGLGWSVADHRAGTGFIVVEAERRIMPMPPMVLHGQLGPPQGATFTRDGSDRVAGQPCTNFRYQGGGQEGRICLSAEGVMLRSLITAGGPMGITGGLEATQIRFVAQDPARFRMPEGYEVMQPRTPRQRPAR